MSEKIHFDVNKRTIQDVMFSEIKLAVPRYQRPYEWSSDQAEELWNDINDKNVDNFIGSIILCREPFKKRGYYEIIDGQQRILSVTLLCAALRDIAKNLNIIKQADRIQSFDISIEHPVTEEYDYRIYCGDSLKAFFRENIQNPDANPKDLKGRTKEEKNVLAVYKYFFDTFLNHLTVINEKTKQIEEIKRVREKVRHLPVILIEVDKEEDAYGIFETTNARGVDLSVADLLKNMIFKYWTVEGEKDEAKEWWDEVVRYIQETEVELKKFLRYFWISKYKFVIEKKLYKSMKSSVEDWKDCFLKFMHLQSFFIKCLKAVLIDGKERSGKEKKEVENRFIIH